MKRYAFFSSSDVSTINLGKNIGNICLPGCLIYLNGKIGSGKTTFCKGFLYALGYRGCVKSPTYILIKSYELRCFTVYHFDFYRIKSTKDLEYIGIREYFDGNAVCLVEWARHGKGILPVSDIVITFHYLNNGRRVTLESFSFVGKKILSRLLSFQRFCL